MIRVSETVGREESIDVTVSPLINDVPRSPRMASLSQCQYWLHTGWSRPSSRLSAAICSADAVGPRIA